MFSIVIARNEVTKQSRTMYTPSIGHFDHDGWEYVITNPHTPQPWVNVLCPSGGYGTVMSQSGTGYSWLTHGTLNRITRWEQDLVRDDWGKFLYLRDMDSGHFWSLSWKPVCAEPDAYECRHGIGYTKISSSNHGIQSVWTTYVPLDDSLEVWLVRLENNSRRTRRLRLSTYLEWCLGVAPDSHREFHKLFIRQKWDNRIGGVIATKTLWAIPNSRGEHWNRNWEYVAFHAGCGGDKQNSGILDKEEFLGRYGSLTSPQAVTCHSEVAAGFSLRKQSHPNTDPISSLAMDVRLKPGEARTLVLVLGAAKNENDVLKLTEKYKNIRTATAGLEKVKQWWKRKLTASWIETPDKEFDYMANIWLKYQVISSRINGRTGYYQTGGAYGFRDQLQDSQVWLWTSSPENMKKQILLHAAHQYEDGTVQHWWHPIGGQHSDTHYSDDLLWLPYMTARYIFATRDTKVLSEKTPFFNSSSATLFTHCERAIEASLQRKSRRGLPLILDGDWNDGLSSVGDDGSGESIWLAHFLCAVLNDWVDVLRLTNKHGRLSINTLEKEREKLKRAINKYGWDGEWYLRATSDHKKIIGSKSSKEGKIFLNSQSWAIIANTAPPERREKILKSCKKYLYKEYGPILLWPGYTKPDESIGYLTRYSAGSRENGGVYTHAACWAVIAECIAGNRQTAWELFRGIFPPEKGKNPEVYRAEPYVTPGNVDGPQSPRPGQAGWTWYTGSAAWMLTAMLNYLIGIRPAADGLLLDPWLPSGWKKVQIKIPYAGHKYNIDIVRIGANKPVQVFSNGKRISGNILKPAKQKSF